MELTLTRQAGTQVAVTCDGQASHAFDLRQLNPDGVEGHPPHPLDDAVEYGQAVFQALFPPATPARQALDAGPDRILLVTTDDDVQAVPWEYAYGPDGFIVLDHHFVRGLPAGQRIPPPEPTGGLHIVAVPSDPLDEDNPPLQIDAEWLRLTEVIGEMEGHAIRLERTRPPTVVQLRNLVAGQQHRIVHFMGHGGQHDGDAVLFFEQRNGAPDPVTARTFTRRVRGTAFLVTLNACVSAAPGQTEFSDLAAALVRRKTPYALGMRFVVADDDARALSRMLYSELARGSSVEEAVLQTRLTLAESPRRPACASHADRWAVGVPVLYTALTEPAPGFPQVKGTPRIEEHQPPLEVTALPRAEGAFRGRIPELRALGEKLTGDDRPRILTIHGGGGQGKTALAREAMERFGHAWPGGVWAIALETLPARETFVGELARFLNIPTDDVAEPAELERRTLAALSHRRTLIVLDNAETLVEGARVGDAAAQDLAQFVREELAGTRASLLVTSREFLGFAGEEALELGGLSSHDGALLFRQSAPQRTDAIAVSKAEGLSEDVGGHPLSLRLLGGAFNSSSIALADFIAQHEQHLIQAADIYKAEDHRHRSLYASIDTSVGYLDDDLRDLLSGLWVFHAPFLPEVAAQIFDEQTSEVPSRSQRPTSEVFDQLHTLWQRGLLAREVRTLRDGNVLLYRLLPTVRPYTEKYMPQAYQREALLARFGEAYADLARLIYRELDRSASVVYVAQQAREDLARGLGHVADGEARGYYLLHWGRILWRLGDTWRGLELTEQALAIAQGRHQRLELEALNNMALVYRATGQPAKALELYEQALPIMREVGDRAGEATTLNNMALVYDATGQPARALKLCEAALPITREVGDRAREATTLNNMGEVYRATGQPARALELYEEALPIRREVGDRAGEATTLNNMAGVYDATGQPARALELYEAALPIMREVGDRAGEATTLNNMALVYRATGQPARARELYEQALPIMREVGDRAGEATMLNNMAAVYDATGQPARALELYEQALPIMREVGDRAGEATTLSNIAGMYFQQGEPERAVRIGRQVLKIFRETGAVAEEASIRFNLAGALHNALGQTDEAIELVTRSVEILKRHGLPQDASGASLEQHEAFLAQMQSGASSSTSASGPDTMSEDQIQSIVNNTVAVMTVAQDQRNEWRETIAGALQDAVQRGGGWQIEVEFFTAVLAILDEQPPTLPDDHPYAQALAAIQAGIAAGGPQETDASSAVLQAVRDFVNAEDWNASRQVVEAQQDILFRPEVETLFEQNIAQARSAGEERAAQMLELHLAVLRECKRSGIAAAFAQLAAAQQTDLPTDLPFDPDIIPRTVAALQGSPQGRMQLAQHTATLARQTEDVELQAFFDAIQTALFGGDLAAEEERLSGVYRQAWQAIRAGVGDTTTD